MTGTLRREAARGRSLHGYWLGWLLLGATILPAGWPAGWTRLALVCLGFAAVHGALGLARLALASRGATAIRVLWWLGLGSTWAAFWVLDLHRARFQVALAAVPLAFTLVLGAAGLVHGPRVLGASWRSALAVSVPLGLGVVWAFMAPRSDNLCTGVSQAYTFTQGVTLVALYLLGPAVLAPSVSRCFLSRRS
jgi:hypothetical protein